MKEAKNAYRIMLASVPPDIKAELDLSFAVSDRIDALMHERGLSKKTVCRCSCSSPERNNKVVKRPAQLYTFNSGDAVLILRSADYNGRIVYFQS